jgi:hypothetical protein
MSSSIWTRCAGDSEIRRLDVSPWRVVEAQHQLSTRKLVDSAEEQMLLEDLLERAKPPSRAPSRLHYLLATPFRYPPLRHGSRFGTRFDPGIWYGSESRRTAFAEVAYYRLVFLEGTSADLDLLTTQHTAFSARVRTTRGVDLSSKAFAKARSAIASPSHYAATQALGADMRAAGVEAARYPSARDKEGGLNVAVFSPRAFTAAKPKDLQTWHCVANRERVEVAKRDYFGVEQYAFDRADFLVNGTLPWPAA